MEFVVGILVFNFALVAILFVYHALGALWITVRVYGVQKRVEKSHPKTERVSFHTWVQFGWSCFVGRKGHGQFIHPVTQELIFWPQPWYRAQDTWAVPVTF